jgi:phosphoribosylaminoimidazole carboxylase PurE protein
MTDKACAIGIIMGSQSDWETMQHVAHTLDRLGVSYETRIVSAHRTPERMFEYARAAAGRGLRVIIAGAGLSAALPGVAAAHSDLPVIGVPLSSRLSAMGGLDAILSIVQMPPGVPVACVAESSPAESATNAERPIRQDVMRMTLLLA